ncbi:MAG: bifunctional molybdopterin-guanine dinucleotide biosynthesis protein MobB/molybdopterin molybdotransferase MoeA [Rhodobacterales bacterium]|nr:MAG: bifunctional molybdopterin-guanine dinucleotide biosynthesis protein MobB/molybdopterin molybdotransferase MoeA [Rhodobacterales bacterium]
MKIYGVVGWKNAGKTGLMERLVAEIAGRGLRVSTVKHAHHAFDLDRPGKDSHRHRDAGASEVLLASYKRWALLHELGEAEEPPMEALLAKLAPCDIVLVEGYKRDSHAKIEVFRAETGHALIQPGDPTVRAIATDTPLDGLPVPLFDLDDTRAIADFILAETGLGAERPAGLAGECFKPRATGALATVAETETMLRASLRPVAVPERVPLGAAQGRVLAAEARARRDNPPAANSAMDGYGFAQASLPAAGVARLALVEGRSAAGAPYPGVVPPGGAVRILTGALLPEGVDTVVMQEKVTPEPGAIRFGAGIEKGANTRAQGEDIAAGAVALARGSRIGAAEIGLAAAVGLGELTVYGRLRVGVLSTGDELAAPGSSAGPARTYDANRPMLRALVAGWGHEAVDLGHIGDDRDALRAAFDGLAGRVDALLTSGGASAGDEDHVSALLREEGQLAQWRVAMKPGKPLLLAQWNRVPVFGLPGNPVSAFATALIFVRPALSVLAGGAWLSRQGFAVPAGFSLAKRAGRREFLRARLGKDGRAELFRSASSGMISSLVWGEGLVELPEDACEIAPGDRVRFLPFSGFGL